MEEHPAYTQALTHYLSLATIVGAVVVVLFILYFSYVSYKNKHSTLLRSISRFALPLGFGISLGGMLLSLFYSQVLLFAPCDLCWYQRILLYPQVFLLAFAWIKKDRAVLPYALLLSLIGLAIALYHHMLQIGFDILKPCSTAPFAVDCAKPSFVEFGFVTFPFMAVVLFSFLSLVYTVGMYYKGK